MAMATNSMCYYYFSWVLVLSFMLGLMACCMASQIGLGSRLLASQDQAWISDNGTFAFGFTPIVNIQDRFQLGIWFNELPGDRTVVWSANR